jgi:Xaa-Pro aminopeptidase
MKVMKIDAIYAEGKASNDPTMYYLLNGANIYGIYVKKRGVRAYVIHSSIEREVAQESGLNLINMNKYDIRKIFGKHKDKIKASAVLTSLILKDLKATGNVAFLGLGAAGRSYHILKHLKRLNKNIKIHYDAGKSLVSQIRETKDEEEVQRIKIVRNGVVKTFNNLLNAVGSMRVKKNIIMKDRKKKLLLGDLKSMLQKELFRMNLISSEGVIVAQGRDAGVPHNAGRNREVVKLGKTIVFDIYPREIGGGYFFDFTRTICFGYAAKEIKEVYKIVRDAQDYVFAKLRVGRRTIDIEKSLCKFFENSGHQTFLSDRKSQTGYCHSLGHGLGLNVHESPTFGLLKTNLDKIKPGHVFTVEPGLYYPNKGYGIRLEDVIYVNKRGKIVNLTNCARKLIVEM